MQCSLFKTPFNLSSGTVILTHRSSRHYSCSLETCCGKAGNSKGQRFVSIEIHSQHVLATPPLLEGLMGWFHSFSVSMEMPIFPADSGYQNLDCAKCVQENIDFFLFLVVFFFYFIFKYRLVASATLNTSTLQSL